MKKYNCRDIAHRMWREVSVFSSNTASTSWAAEEEPAASSAASARREAETEVAVCRSSGTEPVECVEEPSEAADIPRASPGLPASASSCGSGTKFWPEEQKDTFKTRSIFQNVTFVLISKRYI